MMNQPPEVRPRIEPKRALGIRCCFPEAPSGLDPQGAEALSDDLQLLGHPVRLQILSILARNGGKVCVCDLEAALPVRQPTVSHHLRILREAGMIEVERRGLWAYYFVLPGALAGLTQRVAQGLEGLG